MTGILFGEVSLMHQNAIKNKEANLLIAIRYRVYPESVEEFVRYLVYRATQSSSLVKYNELFNSNKESNTDIS